ncbi:ATP-binding protein [Thermopolyspora sp. NPDC052614]|uniref:sensor histidine kinase n=1 Tax=Thermopolyspora sp. NPDC052614 TaxID=3155682 RepID=UPI003447D26F
MVDKWRGWSLRTRLTVLDAAAVAVTALIMLAITLGVLAMRIHNHMTEDVEGAARRVQESIQAGFLGRPVPSGLVELIQVLDQRGRVISSSSYLVGHPPMASFLPSAPGESEHRRLCDLPVAPGRCLRVLARYVDAPPRVTMPDGSTLPGGRWLIYVALPARSLVDPFTAVLAGAALVMVALNAFLTYRVIGRTLAPVRRISAELAEITATDLGRRVTVPPSHGEIEELGSTVNQTLDLLEGLVEQQRRFASDASHDLRSPLTAIRAQVEEARLAPEDTDWPAVTTAILAGVDRLQAIIDDLLMIARLDAGARQARDLVDLAALVRAELERRPRTPEVRERLEPGVVVIGDMLRLARVLANLLDNAERHARSAITIIVRRESGTAVLEVIDDGTGIPPKDREVVFQRFARLDAARSRDAGGTGLGLPIARQIAEAHNGTLTIEDGPIEDGPIEDGPIEDGPIEDGPIEDGPIEDGRVGARFVLRLPLPEVGDPAEGRSR